MRYDYVLDTYAWVEFFNGTRKGKAVKQLLEQDSIATSMIVLAELSDRCAREKLEFEQFSTFIKASATIVPLTEEIAAASGKLKSELRKAAKNVSLTDAIHFQTAKVVEAKFVTGDADFKDVLSAEVIFLA